MSYNVKNALSGLMGNAPGTPTTKSTPTKARQKKKLNKPVLIRMNDNDIKLLSDHFNGDKGLTLSSGIRMLITEYMRDNNLI